MTRMRMPGVRMAAADAVVTAKIPRALAVALREAARANYRTISGEIRLMLVERFTDSDGTQEMPRKE